MSAIYSLWLRELLRFVRRPLAAAGTLALPLLMFLSESPISRQSFAIVGVFSLVLAGIAIADDPHNEFVQGVAAAPVPRVTLLLAKTLAAGTVVLANGVLLAALSLFEPLNR